MQCDSCLFLQSPCRRNICSMRHLIAVLLLLLLLLGSGCCSGPSLSSAPAQHTVRLQLAELVKDMLYGQSDCMPAHTASQGHAIVPQGIRRRGNEAPCRAGSRRTGMSALAIQLALHATPGGQVRACSGRHGGSAFNAPGRSRTLAARRCRPRHLCLPSW